MKFKIPVTWCMRGVYEVEANTLEEAEEKVLDSESPCDTLPKGKYVCDSMAIMEELAGALN